MNVARRFLVAELVWAGGIFVVMLPLALMDSEPISASQVLRWLVRALGLGAFPAGIAVGRDLVAGPNRWGSLFAAVAAACAVGVVSVVLIDVLAPRLDHEARTLAQYLERMESRAPEWESRNHAAWAFFTTLFVPVNTLLYALVGVQLAVWTPRAFPLAARRLVYWAVGLGLLISAYAIWDTTYEAIVIRAAGDLSFAAFYTLLIPFSLCAGFALPTLAFLRQPDRFSSPESEH